MAPTNLRSNRGNKSELNKSQNEKKDWNERELQITLNDLISSQKDIKDILNIINQTMTEIKSTLQQNNKRIMQL